MDDADDPITRQDFSRMVADLNNQITNVVRHVVQEQTPAQNPASGRGDSEAWRLVEELRAEIRSRDRQEIEEMRREMRLLREDQGDPLEQIGQARELVAALGPEPESQLMQGLGILSNVAEAYIEKREEAKQSGSQATPHDEEASPTEYQRPEESHHFALDPSAGPAPPPDVGIHFLEESG